MSLPLSSPGARIEAISLYQLRMPLVVPYVVSLGRFEHFDPLVASVRCTGDSVGWGEAVIIAGYADETPEGGWDFCARAARELLGCELDAARAALTAQVAQRSHAASVLLGALDMLQAGALLRIDEPLVFPLLCPVNGAGRASIAPEIENRLKEGFRTFKVKVGFDVEEDLVRVRLIQDSLAGRGLIRLDANQGFTAEQGRRFASALRPQSIELLEQPCNKHDWEANAAVASESAVPLMLDESIYGLQDIARAAGMRGVGFVKVKLKKFGSVTALWEALELIKSLGLEPVLGDGTATDISCWMEACVGSRTIRNAGENNGFLKLCQPLLEPGLDFHDGSIHLPRGYWPQVSAERVQAHAMRVQHFKRSFQ